MLIVDLHVKYVVVIVEQFSFLIHQLMNRYTESTGISRYGSNGIHICNFLRIYQKKQLGRGREREGERATEMRHSNCNIEDVIFNVKSATVLVVDVKSNINLKHERKKIIKWIIMKSIHCSVFNPNKCLAVLFTLSRLNIGWYGTLLVNDIRIAMSLANNVHLKKKFTH